MNCKASFSTPVKTTVEKLWSVLRDKAENPGRYVPGFIESEEVERDAQSRLCRLHTDRFDILERITIDDGSHTVSFDIIDHPHYTGMLVNRIEPEPTEGGYPVLTYACDWQAREGIRGGDDMTDIMQAALERTRKIAEGE